MARKKKKDARRVSMAGRRWPKRWPTKRLHWGDLDWPYAGPYPGRGIREYVKRARVKEEREAWRIERLNN